jgi:hypothetical protein
VAKVLPGKGEDADLLALARAIVARKPRMVSRLIGAAPELATRAFVVGATRTSAVPYYLTAIEHYVYEGDTALHIAAATYDRSLVRHLIAAGANIAAVNRRGAQPIHYAADGGPTLSTWDPRAQEKTVASLIEAGADPNALDRGAVTPLHRAVRNRCTGAVRALLVGGANPALRNKKGSSATDLVTQTTGRGGTGTAEAKQEQKEILRLLKAASVGRP